MAKREPPPTLHWPAARVLLFRLCRLRGMPGALLSRRRVPKHFYAGNQTATNKVLPSRLTNRSVGLSFLAEAIAWSKSWTFFTG